MNSMGKNREEKIREWINTIVSILSLILIVFGMIWGVGELKKININLNKISADSAEVGFLKTNSITHNCIYGVNQSTLRSGSLKFICNNES